VPVGRTGAYRYKKPYLDIFYFLFILCVLADFIIYLRIGLYIHSCQMSFFSESDLESMEEIQELLRNVQLIFETKIASKIREGNALEDVEEEDGVNDVDPNGCSCSGLRCSCCQRIRIKVFKVNDNCE